MKLAPTIETERLILRGHRAEDFEAYLALVCDPDVMRYITGVATPREQAWQRLLRYPGTWALLGYGMWLVMEKAAGRIVGEVGFIASKRDMVPTTEGTLETGWLLVTGAHGKGYATEAVGAAIAWGDRNFPDMRMTCIIHPENAASLRVARKHGFERLTETTYNEQPTVFLERRKQA